MRRQGEQGEQNEQKLEPHLLSAMRSLSDGTQVTLQLKAGVLLAAGCPAALGQKRWHTEGQVQWENLRCADPSMTSKPYGGYASCG